MWVIFVVHWNGDDDDDDGCDDCGYYGHLWLPGISGHCENVNLEAE